MSWLSQAAGWDKRDTGIANWKRAAVDAEAADPNGRTQNDRRLRTAEEQSAADEAQTGADYRESRAGTTAAADTLANTRPTRTDAARAGTATWQPDATRGVSLDAISRVQAGATGAYNTDSLDTFGSDETRGVNVRGTLDAYTGGPNRFSSAGREGVTYGAVGQGGNLDRYSAGDVSGYDPAAALKEYATGAWAGTQRDLGLELDAQAAQDQGAGRFNSGYWTRDRGRVVSDVTNRFQQAIASKALEAADIKAGMLKSGAGYRLDQAKSADRNQLDASLQGQTLTAADRIAADRFKTDQGRLSLDAGKTALDAELERASGIDRNTLAARTSASGNNLERAKYLDTFGLDRERTATGFALDRAKSLDELGLDATKSTDTFNRDTAEFGDTMQFDTNKAAFAARDAIAGRDSDRNLALGDRYRSELVAGDDRLTGRLNAKTQARQNRFQNWLGVGKLALGAAAL
jgi:hypothetical protein